MRHIQTPKHGLGRDHTQAAAGHGRVNLLLSPVHFGGITQPGFELKEVQVAPGASHAFVDALVQYAAVRAGHALPGADHIKVDTPLGGIELGALHTPGCLQPKGCGEQGFGAQVHEGFGHRSQDIERPAVSANITPSPHTGAEGQVPCNSALSQTY